MLLKWAENSIERSTNQPTLPHAIIVLNKAENNFPETYWDTNSANKWLFAGMDETLHNTARFRKYLDKWEAVKGKTLYTRELLQCYYTTIQVIRVPKLADGTGRPNKIYAQISKLYDQIVEDCKEVQEKKANIRMLLNADQFSPYLHLAIEHFRSPNGLKQPFDFVQASFSSFPISANFGDNIVALARRFKALKPDISFKNLFTEITPLISSCIMLDAAKNDRLGGAAAILPKYSSFYKEALQMFINYWPCSSPGCINTKQGHAVGHQRKNGTVIEYRNMQAESHVPEDFQPYDLTPAEETTFLREIEQSLAEFLGLCPSSMNGAKDAAFDLHKRTIRDFYGKHGGSRGALSFKYNTGCLVCLMDIANHPLPCGHVICTSCSKCYGNKLEPTSVSITQCPLHETDPWPHPCTSGLTPSESGVRVLALDGYVIEKIHFHK
jgi:hypothetical protein